MESPSFPGSSKRAKAPGNVPQVAHCLVDGCNADLSRCRDYHRRHKVCEVHSKTPKVTIGGREQRFCQQCSRFHSLVEFDEGKRSCRKRLDGHNRRRRKPQPDSFNRNSGMVFSSQQGVAAGTRLLSFANPQVLPSAVVGSSWPGIVKAENEIVPYNNQQLCYMERPSSSSFPECTAQSRYKGVNQLQFMQGNECAASICQPLLEPNAAASGSSSDRALSLLSSAAPTTREFRLNHTAQTDQPPRPSQATAHSWHYNGLGRYPFLEESKPLISATGSRSSDASTLRFPEMSPEGSSSSGPHQTLTFRWE